MVRVVKRSDSSKMISCHKYWMWLFGNGKLVLLFVCFFVCLFVCLFVCIFALFLRVSLYSGRNR